jgi:Cu(I)-responsive transcriptional regulator
MNIGEAAHASGVSAKMLRYYERIGLIAPPDRSESGYRRYNSQDIETLRFVRRARDLGLSIARIKQLVALWHDDARPSREVKRIAGAHVAELRRKIADMTAMCATLEALAHACHGDQRPDCPILQDLVAGGGRPLPAHTSAKDRPDAAKSCSNGAGSHP